MTPEELTQSMPFAVEVGIEITSASPTEVRATIDWAPNRTTLGGLLHGWALMTLADSAAAVAAFLNLPEGAVGTSTLESKTNLFGAVRAGNVEAVSKALHVGRSTIVVQTDLFDASGKRIAQTTQTQMILLPRP